MGDRRRGGSCPQQAMNGMGIEVKGPNPVQGGRRDREERRWEEGDEEAKPREKSEKRKRGREKGVLGSSRTKVLEGT